MKRRQLLSLAGGAAALLGRASATGAQDVSAGEAANIRFVTDFCNAWPSRDMATISAFLHDDIVYRVSETSPPLVGREAVVARLKTFFDGADTVQFKVSRTYCVGPVVINERVDTFEGPSKHWRFHLTGMFFLKNGRIREWTDYLIRP
jgi:limonene-1,2-epoxide hydrolase